MLGDFFSILGLLAAELRKHPRPRKILLFLSPTVALLALFLRFYFAGAIAALDRAESAGRVGMFGKQWTDVSDFLSVVFIAGGVLSFLIAVASYTTVDFYKTQRRLESELDSLLIERKELRARIAKEEVEPTHGPADVLDTIRLNLNQLTEYYTINKGQAKSSFRASMGAMFIGLVTIVVGISVYYAQSDGAVKVASITGIAGLIAEFIAAAYFYLYNRSLSQLNYFFDKLTAMQDTMLAIKLCESLADPNRSVATERLITSLVTRAYAGPPNLITASTRRRAARGPNVTPSAI